MKRKKRAVINIDGEPRRVTFWNDDDGMSAKDYLLLISTGVFFTALTVGFIFVLIGRTLGGEYFTLLDAAAPVVMAVVVSVTGIQGVETFVNRRKDNAETTQDKTEEEDVI